jgi:hypothetical protein
MALPEILSETILLPPLFTESVMRCQAAVALAGLLTAAPLAAQENPFAFTGGSVKSAYIVYEVTSKQAQGQGATYEVGVAPDRWIVKMVTPFEVAGKKDTMRLLSVTTRDSQYTYTTMGSQRGDGEVSPTLRPHLAREYAALNAAGKARFKENLKLVTNSPDFGSSSDADQFITITGEKTGSETVAGHKCDVYQREDITACVVPKAPMVMLRWSSQKDGVNMVAKKVTLNGAVPPAATVLPKGVRWEKKEYDDADFITGIWSFKKQTDPAAVPAATIAKFGVGYLASAEATKELREMGAGQDQGDDSGAEDAEGDDETGEDESGS